MYMNIYSDLILREFDIGQRPSLHGRSDLRNTEHTGIYMLYL